MQVRHADLRKPPTCWEAVKASANLLLSCPVVGYDGVPRTPGCSKLSYAFACEPGTGTAGMLVGIAIVFAKLWLTLPAKPHPMVAVNTKDPRGGLEAVMDVVFTYGGQVQTLVLPADCSFCSHPVLTGNAGAWPVLSTLSCCWRDPRWSDGRTPYHWQIAAYFFGTVLLYHGLCYTTPFGTGELGSICGGDAAARRVCAEHHLCWYLHDPRVPDAGTLRLLHPRHRLRHLEGELAGCLLHGISGARVRCFACFQVFL